MTMAEMTEAVIMFDKFSGYLAKQCLGFDLSLEEIYTNFFRSSSPSLAKYQLTSTDKVPT